MKVITQLVKHFWERGALTAEDAQYLILCGFVRAADLEGFKPPAQDQTSAEAAGFATPPLAPRALETVEEALLRRGKKAGKKGAPKLPEIEPEELCDRLRTEFERRAEDLKTLAHACSKKPASTSWEEAAAELRAMQAAKCRTALMARLRKAGVGLSALWKAVDLEPFHRLLSDDEARGRTARAYFALLVSPDAASLGRYGWILKYDEVQALANLRSLHERLLGAIHRLFAEDRQALTRCLAQKSTPVATWSLILLHNASRTGPRPTMSRMEFGPVDPPDDDIWKQAWTAALEMDRAPVARLLVECYGTSTDEGPGPPGGTTIPLYCPKGWHLPQHSDSA